MTITFRSALGRPVVAADTAEEIGKLKAFVTDQRGTRITRLYVAGSKRHAQVVDWDDVNSFGVDVIMVSHAGVLHDVEEDRTGAAVKGAVDYLGSRVLSTDGEEIGTVEDVDFDETTGEVQVVTTGRGRVDGARIKGLGSYAVVLDID